MKGLEAVTASFLRKQREDFPDLESCASVSLTGRYTDV